MQSTNVEKWRNNRGVLSIVRILSGSIDKKPITNNSGIICWGYEKSTLGWVINRHLQKPVARDHDVRLNRTHLRTLESVVSVVLNFFLLLNIFFSKIASTAEKLYLVSILIKY